MKPYVTVVAIASLVALPSCGSEWMKGKQGSSDQCAFNQGMAIPKDDSSAVLATLKGTPLVTENMLQAEKQKFLESNPQMQAMIQMMDANELNKNLVNGIASRKVIDQYILDNKLDQTDEYKKDYQAYMKQVHDVMNAKHFLESIKIAVEDDEIEKFYETNKANIPGLIVSRGGVEAVGVSFKDAAKAKEFADKVRTHKNDITKVAKEAGVSSHLKDFKLVNEESIGIDNELRNKIVAISKTPSVETFKIGNDSWVVAATKKQETKYRPMAEIKNELAEAIKKQKMMEQFEAKIADLKEQYQVVINNDYFVHNDELPAAVTADAGEHTEHAEEVQLPAQAA